MNIKKTGYLFFSLFAAQIINCQEVSVTEHNNSVLTKAEHLFLLVHLHWAFQADSEPAESINLQPVINLPYEHEFYQAATPLILAVANNKNKFLSWLLKQENIEVNKKSKFGDTALMMAAYIDNLDGLKQLIEHKADLTITREKDNCTALHAAAGGCSARTLQELLHAGADSSAVTIMGSTALHTVLKYTIDQEACVRVLLEHKVTIDAQDNSGSTALMYAAGLGHERSLKLLIEAQANIAICNNLGLNALQIAVANDKYTCAKLLLEAGAQVSEKILELAKSRNNTQLINLLSGE